MSTLYMYIVIYFETYADRNQQNLRKSLFSNSNWRKDILMWCLSQRFVIYVATLVKNNVHKLLLINKLSMLLLKTYFVLLVVYCPTCQQVRTLVTDSWGGISWSCRWHTLRSILVSCRSRSQPRWIAKLSTVSKIIKNKFH